MLTKTEYPAAIRELIAQLRQMPGIGPRSAERIALWIVQAGFASSALLLLTRRIRTSRHLPRTSLTREDPPSLPDSALARHVTNVISTVS